MYTDFYGLKEKPFNLTVSSRFLYLSEGHGEALAMLKYGVMERKGFILLSGGIGTGKTTMIQALLDTLDDRVLCIHLSNPLLSPEEFMDYLAFSTFHRKIHFRSKAEFLVEFEAFLHECLQSKTNVILIVDEAHKLSFELLEEIRLLSNMESSDEKLINIFLAGQPELNETLREPQCLPLLQRISVRHHLRPLNLDETRNYVATRLTIAGASNKQEIFSKDAVTALHTYAQGNPRVINILADNALVLGYARAARPITSGTVRKCYEDMSLQRSFPDASEETSEPYELKRREGSRGRFWKWAIPLCLIGALVAFAGTRTGRESLWKVFGLKAPGWELPADTVGMGEVESQQGASSGTAGSVPLEEMHEHPSPNAQMDGQEGQSTEIEQADAPRDDRALLNEEQPYSSADVMVQQGAICRAIYHKRPLVSGESFRASVGKLYCFTMIVGAVRTVEITHVWHFGNIPVARIPLPVKSPIWRTYSARTIRAQDIGDWHVNVLGPQGNVIWSTPFEVTP
jgi:general secretion pathway protein A